MATHIQVKLLLSRVLPKDMAIYIAEFVEGKFVDWLDPKDFANTSIYKNPRITLEFMEKNYPGFAKEIDWCGIARSECAQVYYPKYAKELARGLNNSSDSKSFSNPANALLLRSLYDQPKIYQEYSLFYTYNLGGLMSNPLIEQIIDGLPDNLLSELLTNSRAHPDIYQNDGAINILIYLLSTQPDHVMIKSLCDLKTLDRLMGMRITDLSPRYKRLIPNLEQLMLNNHTMWDVVRDRFTPDKISCILFSNTGALRTIRYMLANYGDKIINEGNYAYFLLDNRNLMSLFNTPDELEPLIRKILSLDKGWRFNNLVLLRFIIEREIVPEPKVLFFWFDLSSNPDAVELLIANPQHIVFEELAGNPRIVEVLRGIDMSYDTFLQKIENDNDKLFSNPGAIDLLEKKFSSMVASAHRYITPYLYGDLSTNPALFN